VGPIHYPKSHKTNPQVTIFVGTQKNVKRYKPQKKIVVVVQNHPVLPASSLDKFIVF
jgi:hypothetical protein